MYIEKGDVIRRRHIEGDYIVRCVGQYEACLETVNGHLHSVKLDDIAVDWVFA